jgi:hypothetical protein
MLPSGSADDRFRQSYQRGFIVFIYGLGWLAVSFAGLWVMGGVFPTSNNLLAVLVRALWSAALVGAIAGATAMLQRLGHSLASALDSWQQSLLAYFLRPILGLIAGVISLVVVTIPATLLINFATTRTLSWADSLTSSTTVALSLLLAAIAGYYLFSGLKQFTTKPAPAEGTSLTLAPELTHPSTAEEVPFAFKLWFEQRQEMARWSLRWGLVIFFYGLAWLVGLILSLVWIEPLFNGLAKSSQPVVNLVGDSWPTIVAGGMGGVVAMLGDLYRHTALKQDFHRQQVMSYLVQPVIGLVFGGCIYLFVASGYLSLESLTGIAPAVVDSPTVIALQLVLGWLVGFRPKILLNLVRRVVQAVINFFRSASGLLSTQNLKNRSTRDEALSDFAQQADLFRPFERDSVRRKP